MQTITAAARASVVYLTGDVVRLWRWFISLFLLVIASFALSLPLAAPAHALSDACQNVNAGWGVTRSFGPVMVPRPYNLSYGTGFSSGETLAWKAQAGGSTNPINDPHNEDFGGYSLIFDGVEVIGYNYSNIEPGFVDDKYYEITDLAVAAAELYIEVDILNDKPGSTNTVNIQVVCYDKNPPTVISLLPEAGSTQGGTEVTIEGTGFVDVSGVYFAGAPASSYTVVSPTKITAIAPSGSAGAATVSVRNTYGDASQTRNFTYAAPPEIVPASGALPIEVVGVSYSGSNFSATAGVAPYRFSLANGDALPSGLLLAATGEVTGIPDTAGDFGFTIVVEDDIGSITTAAYTMTVAELPVVTDGSTTVFANSTNKPVTLHISGGAPASVTVSTQATKGTATANGITIAYTPTAGFSGTDSFQYTATNAAGTSSPATITVTVAAPTLVISPASGPLTAGTENAAYSSGAIGVTNGTAPYTFALANGSALPTGLLLNTSTGQISGTPSVFGNFSFTLDIVDDNGAPGAVSYTLAIAEQLPVTGAVSTTVDANSTNNPVTLDLSGGNAVSIAIGTQASHGTANVSGTSVTYTPQIGYSGPDSFTYTATNSAGTSAPATVSITVTPPVPTLTSISPNDGSAEGGDTITISGSGLTGSTAVKIGSQSASNVTVVNDITITAVTPATLVGVHDVVVTTPGGPLTLAGGFTSTSWVSAPIPQTISPTSGPTTGGTIVTIGGAGFTNATGVYFDGVAAQNYTIETDGRITATTPAHAAGIVGFEITSAGGNGAITDSYTYVAPVISFTPASGTLPAGQAAVSYSQSFAASGAAAPYAYAVTAGTLPAGLALSSEGALEGVPTAVGSFNFTITATDNDGISDNASYQLVINAPSITFGPPTLPSGKIEETYSQSLVASGGNAGYSYMASGALPAGLTLSGDKISGTPTVAGIFNFTISVSDSTTGTGAPFSVSQAYSLTIDNIAPIAGNSMTTVDANSTNNTVPLDLSGGTPASLALGTQATKGLATVSGLSISYSPNTGFSGTDSFTYTATNDAGVSAPATVTITVSAPTFAISPAEGALAGGTMGVTYSSGNITVSNGTAPYTFTLANGDALPDGLTLDTATGNISGTPTSQGNADFTINIVDANGATGWVDYSIAIAEQLPVAGAVSRTVAANSANNAITLALSGGAASSVAIDTQAAHGTATASGTSITYTPQIGYSGSDSFTYTATNSAGTSNPATVTITVTAVSFSFSPAIGDLPEGMAGEDYKVQITANGGAAPLRYRVVSGTLPDGLTLSSSGELSGTAEENTEGDYDFTVEVADANNATATADYGLALKQRTVSVENQTIPVTPGSSPPDVRLDKNATGGPFDSAAVVTVEPANAGTATITMGDYAQVGPVSPVGWYLKFTPAPNYHVGTVVVSFRLTSGVGSSFGTITYSFTGADEVKKEINGLVRDFVKTRQNLIASGITVPGLMERRRMEGAADPVTTRLRPSERGMTFGFSTSLAQLQASRDGADGVPNDGELTPFNIWIDSTLLFHNRKENDNQWGSFAMVSAGADYLLSDKALLGISFHYDRMTDPTDEDAELTGNGWFVGPYASFEIGKGVFWDTSLLYGGSVNTIDTAFWDGDFDTTRWMIETSIKGQWNIDDVTVLTPKLRALYFSETVDTYSVKNDLGDQLTLDGFTTEQFRVSLGAEIARQFTLKDGSRVVPKLGVTGGIAGLEGNGAFGSISAGLTLETAEDWSLDFTLLYNVDGDGEKAAGAKAGVSKRF